MTAKLNTTTTIAHFNLDAPALREAVDLIADRAMAGRELAAQAMAAAPTEFQPLLNELRALFCSIGHAADATSDDVGADLSQVWSLDVARGGTHELVAANSPTIDEPEAA